MARPKIRVVTGYVPIIGHPRSVSEYGALGERLAELDAGLVHPFYSKYEDCWIRKLLDGAGTNPTWSVGDNPKKNSLKYQIVTHQKFAWLAMALAMDASPDTFIWLDYGICHVPGVTPEVIKDFLDRVQFNDFAIPGCWTKDDPRSSGVGDMYPNWRFCGGLMVVPREQVIAFFAAIKRQVKTHLALTNNITWDVNNVARVEAGGKFPIRWYQADHNETMFTAY